MAECMVSGGGSVPITRKINGKSLDKNVNLVPSDVGITAVLQGNTLRLTISDLKVEG